MAQNGTLSTKQLAAIAALLTSKSITEAAEVSGAGRRTLHRWLEDPAFRQALSAAEAELVSQSARRLANGADLALSTLKALMAEEAPESARLGAAKAWLDQVLKFRQLSELEDRLADLEARFDATLSEWR